MALKEYLGNDEYKKLMTEVSPLVTEFDKLPKGEKVEKATEVFAAMKTYERGTDFLLDDIGQLAIENELKSENRLMKKDLKDLNKYDPEKYKKLMITEYKKNDKKTRAKQYIYNKIHGKIS
jgi:hypothetical protein